MVDHNRIINDLHYFVGQLAAMVPHDQQAKATKLQAQIEQSLQIYIEAMRAIKEIGNRIEWVEKEAGQRDANIAKLGKNSTQEQ